MKKELIGVNKFLSKAGKEFSQLVVITECNARDIKRGCSGKKAENIFVPDTLLPLVNSIGQLTSPKEILLEYEVFDGRPELISFDIVETVSKNKG